MAVRKGQSIRWEIRVEEKQKGIFKKGLPSSFRSLLVVGNILGSGEILTLTLTSFSTPPFSSLSDTMIMDSIAAFLVLPNRLLVPLVPDLQDVAQLRSPLPRVWSLPY